jgi:hypothetical protein
MAAALPAVRLLVLLRNPVDRAYSHYQHEVKLGAENLPFEEAVDREGERLGGEIEKLSRDALYISYNHLHYSYLGRGLYAGQLKTWLKFFPRERMKIIQSEDLFERQQEIYSEVLKFLDLPERKLQNGPVHNHLSYREMNPLTRGRLNAYFEPFNQELYDLLGVNFDWGHP